MQRVGGQSHAMLKPQVGWVGQIGAAGASGKDRAPVGGDGASGLKRSRHGRGISVFMLRFDPANAPCDIRPVPHEPDRPGRYNTLRKLEQISVIIAQWVATWLRTSRPAESE